MEAEDISRCLQEQSVSEDLCVYRSYTLDLKARILPETTVEKAVPLLGGNIEQALEQTT